MSSTKVKAVVIGGVNVKEKDKLITLFSLEKGKLTISMRGVRGDKAKLKSAKEPFTFGEFIIEEGKTNIITGVDIIDNFYDISKDIDRYYEACAIIDVVNKIASGSNPPLFIELIKALKTICYENVKKYYCLDKFLLFVFKAMGYEFLTSKCSSCGSIMSTMYLNLEIGELVCPACKNALCVKVPNSAYSAMRLLANTDYEKLASVKFGGMGEIQAYDILRQNFRFRSGYEVIKF